MYAEGAWNGTGFNWTLTALESGVVGYGVYSTITHDTDGNPVIAHVTANTVRLVRRTSSGWLAEPVVSGRFPYLAIDAANQVCLAHASMSNVSLTSAPLNEPTPWSTEIVDPSTSAPASIQIAPDGLPALSYHRSGTLRFAHKKPTN